MCLGSPNREARMPGGTMKVEGEQKKKKSVLAVNSNFGESPKSFPFKWQMF